MHSEVKTAVVLKIGKTIEIPCSDIAAELIDKFLVDFDK